MGESQSRTKLQQSRLRAELRARSKTAWLHSEACCDLGRAKSEALAGRTDTIARLRAASGPRPSHRQATPGPPRLPAERTAAHKAPDVRRAPAGDVLSAATAVGAAVPVASLRRLSRGVESVRHGSREPNALAGQQQIHGASPLPASNLSSFLFSQSAREAARSWPIPAPWSMERNEQDEPVFRIRSADGSTALLLHVHPLEPVFREILLLLRRCEPARTAQEGQAEARLRAQLTDDAVRRMLTAEIVRLCAGDGLAGLAEVLPDTSQSMRGGGPHPDAARAWVRAKLSVLRHVWTRSPQPNLLSSEAVIPPFPLNDEECEALADLCAKGWTTQRSLVLHSNRRPWPATSSPPPSGRLTAASIHSGSNGVAVDSAVLPDAAHYASNENACPACAGTALEHHLPLQALLALPVPSVNEGRPALPPKVICRPGEAEADALELSASDREVHPTNSEGGGSQRNPAPQSCPEAETTVVEANRSAERALQSLHPAHSSNAIVNCLEGVTLSTDKHGSARLPPEDIHVASPSSRLSLVSGGEGASVSPICLSLEPGVLAQAGHRRPQAASSMSIEMSGQTLQPRGTACVLQGACTGLGEQHGALPSTSPGLAQPLGLMPSGAIPSLVAQGDEPKLEPATGAVLKNGAALQSTLADWRSTLGSPPSEDGASCLQPGARWESLRDQQSLPRAVRDHPSEDELCEARRKALLSLAQRRQETVLLKSELDAELEAERKRLARQAAEDIGSAERALHDLRERCAGLQRQLHKRTGDAQSQRQKPGVAFAQTAQMPLVALAEPDAGPLPGEPEMADVDSHHPLPLPWC
mmetsp:Transcript_65533/g.211332  ORF Transcript_65533/g.211332 Transcript_65533/m.211332 type:complete len:816 (-) Transcript_65533:23-2470(-)